MPQIINPLMTQALNRYSDTQDVFSKRAKSVSDNSKTSGDPAASPSDYVAAMGKRLDLLVKQQAKINAISAISYCKVTASGQEAIKETFSAINNLAIKNATDTTSAQERAINQQSFSSKVSLINQVNQTVGLNTGQPTTAGTCTILPTPAATTAYCANAGCVMTVATAAGSNDVCVITDVATGGAVNKLKISSKFNGVTTNAAIDTVVNAGLIIATDFTITAPSFSATDSASNLSKFQKMLKQNAMSASDAQKATNLVSMINVLSTYAPDARVQSTTLQSLQYSNMYAKLTSTPGTGTVVFTLNTGWDVLTTAPIDPTSSQKIYTFNDSGSKATDVTIDISTLSNLSVAIAETFVQFGAAPVTAVFQTADTSTASIEVDIQPMTIRSLGLDAISITQKSDAITAMTTLQGIQSTILGGIANVELGVSKLELAETQLNANIAATESVIEAMDGLNPLNEAQAMASLDQQLQANVTIISKIISQQTMLQQAFSSLLRG